MKIFYNKLCVPKLWYLCLVLFRYDKQRLKGVILQQGSQQCSVEMVLAWMPMLTLILMLVLVQAPPK